MNVPYTASLLKEALETRDERAIFDFAEYMSHQAAATSRATAQGQQADQPTGAPSGWVSQANTAFRFVMGPGPNGQTNQKATVDPPGRDNVMDYWVMKSPGLTIGDVVCISPGGTAQAAMGFGDVAARQIPDGVVTQVSGKHVRVRNMGPAVVRIDSLAWLGDENELWLSETAAGMASCKMPSARNDIVLLGHRIGPMRGQMIRAFVKPMIHPATRVRVWEYDEDNYIDYEFLNFRGTKSRMAFVVGGRTCMMLQNDASVWLRAGFREVTSVADVVQTAADSPNGEIEYNPVNESISFAVQRAADGLFVRAAELFPDGTLQCWSMQEFGFPLTKANSPRFTAYYGPHTWVGAYALAFTLNQQNSYMRFLRVVVDGKVNARLDTKGIRENAL